MKDFPEINLIYNDKKRKRILFCNEDRDRPLKFLYFINEKTNIEKNGKINEKQNFNNLFKDLDKYFKDFDKTNLEIYKKNIIFSFFLLFEITKSIKEKEYLNWTKKEESTIVDHGKRTYSYYEIPETLKEEIDKKIESHFKQEIKIELEREKKETNQKKNLENESKLVEKKEIPQKKRNYKIHIFLFLVLLIFLIIFFRSRFF